MYLKIRGRFSKRNLKIDGVNFGKMGPEEHKRIIHALGPHNYPQIPGWIVSGTGEPDCTLLLEREVAGRIEEKEVLDFQAMYSVHNFGYDFQGPHGRIVGDIVDYLEDPHAPKALPGALDHKYRAPALTALTKFTGLDRAIMKSGGAETVETAYSTGKKFWHQERVQTLEKAYAIASQSWRRERKKIAKNKEPIVILPDGNFHGRTLGPRSFSTDPKARDGFDPLLGHVHHVRYGDLNELEAALSHFEDYVASVIIEPIQGEGGVIIPPPGYLPGVAELCQIYETLFILDEIQTGYGRTGTDLAYERYDDLLPDMVCLGKAMGGGVVPVSAVVGKDDVMSCIKQGTEGATWSSASIQCVAAVAAIRELSDCKLSAHSAKKGAFFLERLKNLQNSSPEIITDVRGQGLFVGVDTIFDGHEVSLMLLEEGIWAKETGQTGKTIRFSPPLTITLGQLEKGIQAFGNVIDKLKKRLPKS